MYTYLTKVIVIAGFYMNCTGVVMGHNHNKEYYVALTCQDEVVTDRLSAWIEAKDLKKVEKK